MTSRIAIGHGVETSFHPHEVDARLCVARHDCALDRGSAPPPRQQRGVEVYAASSRRYENWNW